MHHRSRCLVAIIITAALPIAPAFSQKAKPRPEVFGKLIDCRGITDATARLACYDERVDALDAAERRNDVVVVDRGQVRQARRSLFGLTLPRLSIFGGDDDKQEGEGFTQIETTISRAYVNSNSRWVVILADGARWVQVDNKSPAREPQPGDKIRIRRAAMGSFFANINDRIAIRMRREN